MNPVPQNFNINNLDEIKHLYAVLGKIRGKVFRIRKFEAGKLSTTIWAYIRDLQRENDLKPQSKLTAETIDLINRLAFGDSSDPAQIKEVQGWLLKLGYAIDIKEREEGVYGPTTRAAVKKAQGKYGLEATGELDENILKRLKTAYHAAIHRERPDHALLKINDAARLRRVQGPLRLNHKGTRVQALQLGLAWLGYSLHEDEYKTETFGKQTRLAVIEYQKANELPAFGEANKAMVRLLNEQLAVSNPKILDSTVYRIKGAIREIDWKGVEGAKVQVFEKKMRGELILLNEKSTLKSGFYDLIYQPPTNPKTNKPKTNFHVLVRLVNPKTDSVKELIFFNAAQVIWANFTDGDIPYQGESSYEKALKQLECGLEDLKITKIEESEEHQDITYLYRETGMNKHEILHLSLAHRIAEYLKEYSAIGPAIVYAFLCQGGIDDGTKLVYKMKDWKTWINSKVKRTITSLALMPQEEQERLLAHAVQQNRLPIKAVLNLEKTKEQLQKLKVERALDEPLIAGVLSLKEWLSLSKTSPKEYEAIAGGFAGNYEDTSLFLEELKSLDTVADKTVEKLEETYQLASITTFHLPMIKLLQEQLEKTADRKSTQEPSVRNYAKWLTGDWTEFVKANKSAIPSDLVVEEGQDKVLVYAASLQQNIETIYPDVALVAHIGRSDEHQLKQISEVSNFLDNNRNYNLRTNHIEAFVLENPDTLSKEAVEEIKVLKRIQNVAVSAQMGQALLENKVYSAGQIYSMGQSNFAQMLNANHQFSGTQISQAFNNASGQYAGALTLAGMYSFNQLNPKAIISITNRLLPMPTDGSSQGLPNLNDLFGSNDHCACQECQSVYSPAAYLTDVLRFLGEKNSTSTNPKTAREILLERRPDIDDIDLNCENAHTLIPYIDLVCEILENQVSYGGIQTADFVHNTTLATDQLKALPEYEKGLAYLALGEYRTMHGHYNLWQSKTNLFLQHLGISYAQLIENWNSTPDWSIVAASHFGINTVDKAFVTNQLRGGLDAQYLDFIWGHQHDYTQTSSTDALLNKNVADFLRSSQLSYAQLLELFQLEFVNAGTTTVIERPYQSCDIQHQIIKGDLTLDKFTRLTQFLSLWRSTPWEMWELDLLLKSGKIGNGVINDNTLSKLHKFDKLQKELKLTVEELLPFYEPLDTTARRDSNNKAILPFYSRLFLNPAMDGDLQDFEISTVISTSISPNHASIVAAVVGADADEVASILTSLNGSIGLFVLTIVYQRVTLCEKLGCSLGELQKLQTLLNLNPFSSIENTCHLIESYRALRKSQITIEEAEYLLTVNTSDLEISTSTIAGYWDLQEAAITELKEELFNADLVVNGLNQTPEKLRDMLERHLATIPTLANERDLKDAVDLIYGEGRWDPTPTPNSLIGSGGSNTISIPIWAQVDSFVNTKLNFVSNRQAAKTILNPSANVGGTVEQKINYILTQLEYYFKRLLVLKQVATNLGLEESMTHLLLSLEANNGVTYYDILRQAPNATTLEEAYYPLHKMALLLQKWQLTSEELNNYLPYYSNPTLSILFLTELPITTNLPVSLLPKLLNWWGFIQLDRKYQTGLSIGQIWSISNATDFYSTLANYLGIEGSILSDISTHFAWNLTDFREYGTVKKLISCLAQHRILGVNVSTIANWVDRDQLSNTIQVSTATTTDFDNLFQEHILVANEVQEAAKAKYTNKQWLDTLAPIQDQLRLQKRDALVTHFTASQQLYRSSNHLFQHFLIDVDMSPCQMTSRLKQAISSVQLFVQRCIMSLETEVQVPYEDPITETVDKWKEWEWMQNYRVWEANRKVFLYPENWIEPELRDDKTPFFKELEEELLQSEITQESAEIALANYLYKLDQVAQLEVVGMCYGQDDNNNSLVHVLGRTKEIPTTYYFRTYNESFASWDAWEKIEVDIKGDHPIPYVYNNKVHIFWLEIIEKPMKIQKLTTNNLDTSTNSNDDAPQLMDSPNQYNYKEIQLAWTVLRTTGWTQKKLSKKKIIHPWPRPFYSLHLRPRMRGLDDLWLDIYVSTSNEFNEEKYFNQFKNRNERLTGADFDENQTPWHSSSFVFNGFVRKVKLVAIPGDYSIYNTQKITTTSTPPTQDPPRPLKIYSLYLYESQWLVKTNYGEFFKNRPNRPDRTDLNAKISQHTPSSITSPVRITKIQHLFLSPHFDIEVSWGLGNSKTYNIRNNRENLEALNNLIATGNEQGVYNPPTPTTTTVTTTTVTVEEAINDSFNYVHNQFGKEGRDIERLYDYERGDNLILPNEMHYEFNYLTNNKVHSPNNRFLHLPRLYHSLLLSNAKAPFRLVAPMEEASDLNWQRYKNVFYQDDLKSFFINFNGSKHIFYPFYHAFTKEFTSKLYSQGVAGLLDRKTQKFPSNNFYFSDYIVNNSYADVSPNGDLDIVDFDRESAYSTYNWELFFHAPLLVATQLSKNQRFEEAMKWFHFIFNPTNTESDGETPQRFWITKPFFDRETGDYQTQQIVNILNSTHLTSIQAQIKEWKENPFKPHLVARSRTVAYQRTVVMKYIDNLIAWGDQLFRRESLESINQATLLYITASELLGERPVQIPALDTVTKNFDEIKDDLDDFGNANVLIAAEGLMAMTSLVSNGVPIPNMMTKYFCIPNNQKLLGYWDLVEDRLFKIRHCMNIDGVVRQLSLFAPPIDPALLVNATAMGLDLGIILDDMSAPRSNYRFKVLSRTASQFCSEVKSLGQSMLSALQTKDAEGMALLQSTNALKVLDATVHLKELQIEETKESLNSLATSKQSAIIRKGFYESREFMNEGESKSRKLSKQSIDADIASTVLTTIASLTTLIPDFDLGISGMMASPVAVATFGGTHISNSLRMGGALASAIGGILQKESSMISQTAGFQRRQEEWDLQAELATKEIEQIEQQIAAAKIRLAIAEKDLDTHQLQIENNKTEGEYLKSKYTNQQLYSWMVSQISTTYFQAYQLAYDMAKRAEKSFKYELALSNASTTYVKFGYWDSLKKGLLSGDKLMLAINKMEAAYLEQNKRELELNKQISLRRLAPAKLLQLITTGECVVEIPEWWFDMDFAGHYMRRIKALSVSIPCIVGPYTNVNCMLTLEKHRVRTSAISSTSYNHYSNYEESFGAVESVAISHGQNDGGVFELNFNDERYLPFEGAGVISRWKLKLPNKQLAQFDYTSITDVVLNMHYTARNGGQVLADEATNSVQDIIQGQLTTISASQPATIISLKQEFATAWHRFIYPDVLGNKHALSFKLDEKHFPYFTKFASGRTVQGVRLYLLDKDSNLTNYNFDVSVNSNSTTILLTNNMPMQNTQTLISSSLTHNWQVELNEINGSPIVSSTTSSSLLGNIDDIIVIFDYEITV